MIKSCKICGCVFENEIEDHCDIDEMKYYEPTMRDCPLCKLGDDIPEMLRDLEDNIRGRGMYDPDY